MTPDEEATAARWALGEDAGRALAVLDLYGPDGPTAGAGPALAAIAASPTGRYALPALARMAQAEPGAWEALAADTRALVRFATVAGASDAFGDLLARQAEARKLLTGPLESWDPPRVREGVLAALADAEDPAWELTMFQRLGLLRIAARDLLGFADMPQVSWELAALADGILDAAVRHICEAQGLGIPPLAVIGMGKLGGQELNYLSDVDIMFVSDGEITDATRVAEELLRLVGQITPSGRAYELDVNLRPEGRDGPLVRTLESYRAYYERWASTWEFQALLKARPVAGDLDLGVRFGEAVSPFVWPDKLPSDSVGKIQQMKERVEHSKPVLKGGPREVKLAPGGLRDIEFAVQLLQLVHGRHDGSLRSPTTLVALDALAQGGYVGDEDAQTFIDAYQYLRTVEHRLQLLRLRRTHTLPKSAEERTRIARAIGVVDTGEQTALAQFDREYQRVQGQVRTLHEKLFYRPLLARFAQVGGDEVLTEPGGGLDEHAALERLAALGFTYPDGALVHLDAMAEGVSRRARLVRVLLPAILPRLAEAPDPDGGLAALRSLTEKLGDAPNFLRVLRDTPPVGELLATVLGASRLVGQWLERQPDVIGTLADGTELRQAVPGDRYRRMAEGLVRRGGEQDQASDSLRRMRRREATRIAVRDLSGMAEVTEVAEELTGLADACLEAAVQLAVPSGVRMSAIALGKLGGGELGYTSDLDVLLVFEPDVAMAEAIAAAEQLMRLLGEITPEGQAFQVDLGLRPEGRDGPLARTLGSYQQYYERWAQSWEFQALTQARPVAGDPELGSQFMDMLRSHVYPATSDKTRLTDIRRMKARVERERTRPPRPSRVGRPARPAGTQLGRRHHPTAYGYPSEVGGVESWQAGRPTRPEVVEGQRVDVKLGPGGLADVEWTVQLLQLAHGHKLAEVQVPGTLGGLAALESAGVIATQDAAWLREGWQLASRLRNSLYLAGARDTSILPSGPMLAHIAAMLHDESDGSQELMERVGRTMRRVRQVHERLFYEV